MMHPQKSLPLPMDDKSASMELPQIHADTIGRLVLEKFMEVIKGQESYSRRKVLAGIVMTENMNFNEAQVSIKKTKYITLAKEIFCMKKGFNTIFLRHSTKI